jgi:hypothetical protein
MKKCEDCKHYTPPGLWHTSWCNNRILTGTNVDDGTPDVEHTFTMREDTIGMFHEMGKTCGIEAAYFEPIPPSWLRRLIQRVRRNEQTI